MIRTLLSCRRCAQACLDSLRLNVDHELDFALDLGNLREAVLGKGLG